MKSHKIRIMTIVMSLITFGSHQMTAQSAGFDFTPVPKVGYSGQERGLAHSFVPDNTFSDICRTELLVESEAMVRSNLDGIKMAKA